MTLKPDKIPDLLPTLSDAAVKTNDKLNKDGKERAFVSKGEKLHKWVTYLSVDWVFNAAMGVAFAYGAKFTDFGQKYWSGPITEGFTKLLKPIIKDPKSLEKSVGNGNMFMSIIAGGMLTIPPLMILENPEVKKSIIKKYDEWIYGKETVANDPKFQQAYDEIQEAPKKGFWTGMLSRFAALAPLLATVVFTKPREISTKHYFSHISNASEAAAHGLGFSEKSFAGLPTAEAKKRWQFIHEGIAMDAGLGLPYAGLHAVFYNMFAGFKGKECKTETAPELAAAPASNEIVPQAAAEPAKPESKKEELAASASHAARELSRRAETSAQAALTPGV